MQCDNGNWGNIDVSKDTSGNLEVLLENSQIKARYAIGKGGRKGQEWAIRDLVIKSANEDQAGRYVDACATRGFLSNAKVVREETDSKTVLLEFDDGNAQEVSVLRGLPVLRIKYLKYGVNVVDIGSPGGKAAGQPSPRSRCAGTQR